MSSVVVDRPVERPERSMRFLQLIRSELIKVMTVRSMLWTLMGMSLGGAAITTALTLTMESAGVPDAPSAAFTAWNITLGMVMFGQVLAAVLGVLAMSGEYSSGTIQSTLLAEPRRLPVLAAKAVVLFFAVSVTAALTMVVLWAVTHPLFEELGIASTPAEPAIVAAILGGASYLGLVSVFGVGVAALLRSSAGGIAAILVVLFLVPTGVQVMGASVGWAMSLWPYLLSNAGEVMSTVPTGSGVAAITASPVSASPVLSGCVALGWAIIALIAGAIRLQRRDA